jgi:hypothetical protein
MRIAQIAMLFCLRGPTAGMMTHETEFSADIDRDDWY